MITKKILNSKILLAIYLLAIKHFIFKYIKELVDYIKSFRIVLISLKPGITLKTIWKFQRAISKRYLKHQVSLKFPRTIHITSTHKTDWDSRYFAYLPLNFS